MKNNINIIFFYIRVWLYEVAFTVDAIFCSNRRDPSLTITPATVRDLRALTTSGLTITPAPASVYRTDATANSTSNATNNNTLSVTATAAATTTENPRNSLNNRRVLRPRTEPRSYAETPDIVLLPAKVNGNSRGMSNGNYDSDSDDCDVPPLYPIKVKIQY